MKSFKALTLLTLAAALSCSAKASPTNVTTDGYPTKPSQKLLKSIMDSLQDIADLYFKQYGQNYPFTKEYVDRLAWVRPYNYIICLVEFKATFDGIEGNNWDHGPIYYPNPKDPSTDPTKLVKYEVIVGGSGTFERQGNSGWFNWAWNGYVAAGQDIKSNRIQFVKPPTTGNGRPAEGGGD